MSRKNSLVNIILAIVVVLVGLQVIRVVFHVGIGLLKLFFPVILVGFAIYGFIQFFKNR